MLSEVSLPIEVLAVGRRDLNLRDKFTKMSYGLMIEHFVLPRLIQIFGMWLLGQYWTSCTWLGPGMPLLSMALRLQNTSIKLLMVRHVSRERAIPPETNQDHNVKGSSLHRENSFGLNALLSINNSHDTVKILWNEMVPLESTYPLSKNTGLWRSKFASTLALSIVVHSTTRSCVKTSASTSACIFLSTRF